jgi:hypothetical protein
MLQLLHLRRAAAASCRGVYKTGLMADAVRVCVTQLWGFYENGGCTRVG